MNQQWTMVLAGVALAIGITTGMDATGYSELSALPLMPLFILFWWVQKCSRAEVGFRWGALSAYGWAVAYPLVVIGVLAAVAFAVGAVDTSATDWRKAGINLAVMALMTTWVVILTEEGFFRGWLWAGLTRAGMSPKRVLLSSSLIFMAWHISAVSLETGFDLPARQIPVYLVNATLLGMNWGLLRQLSGSVVVASVSHGVWNGMAYILFGFGDKLGALGITNTMVFSPENGFVGIVLNAGFAFVLWRKVMATR